MEDHHEKQKERVFVHFVIFQILRKYNIDEIEDVCLLKKLCQESVKSILFLLKCTLNPIFLEFNWTMLFISKGNKDQL